MKKLIAMLLCLTLLAIIPISVSAGDILWKDDFNSGEINEADWYPGAFYVDNGGPTKSPHVEDFAGWHVLQSMYGNDNGGNRTFGANVAFKVDAWAWEDGGDSKSEHKLGLWWADYFSAPADGRIVYQFQVCFETRKAVLIAAGEGDAESYYDAGVYSDGTIVASWDIPDSIPFEMDVTDPTVISLGMRVNGAKIECFVNDTKAISFTAPRMGGEKSPILLVNDGCYAGFDNFVVATADYDLFNEGANQGNNEPVNNDPAETETEKRIETKVVHETNEAGEDVTVIVTEEVVVPVANTGRSNTGTHSSSKTGDAAIIVVAVMIVSIGGAIVVKKVYGRK